MNSRDVPIAEIPMAILDEVENGLRHFFVPILALWETKQGPDLKLIGSGTLIEKEGKGYILTAGHVWGASDGADALHLILRISDRAKVEIPYSNILEKTIWDRNVAEEWGPDLALLEIPQPQLSLTRAYKSFINFDTQSTDLSENPPIIEKSLWALYGVTNEESSVIVNRTDHSFDVELVTRAFFCGIVNTHSMNEFDYYDTRANLALPGVPSKFGGVSGGGLWQVTLSISKKSGEISWDGRPRLRGVAFWQSAADDEHRIIRCHGPHSIFDRLGL